MHLDIDWQQVDTVLLDMDGTLLDLAFDNYFWQKLVPETYGEQQGISPAEAQAFIRSQYSAVQHTLNGTVWTTGASASVWIFVP